MIDVFFTFPTQLRPGFSTIFDDVIDSMLSVTCATDNFIIIIVPEQSSCGIIYWRKIGLKTLFDRSYNSPVVKMPVVVADQGIV